MTKEQEKQHVKEMIKKGYSMTRIVEEIKKLKEQEENPFGGGDMFDFLKGFGKK